MVKGMKSAARILVVDDHPNAAFILAQVLRSLGNHIEIIIAHSGEEALSLIGNEPIHIVITDFLMPGMNGLELVEKIQNRPCAPPDHTILITAYNTEGLALTARHLRIDDYLTKPVDPEKVRAIVTDTLSGIQSTPSSEAPEVDNKQFTILVVDDNPDNLRLITTRLANEGYTFMTADDGQEALEKAWEIVPDLILLDVNMPGKGGFEVLQEIRANSRTRHIQVLMVTAVRTQPHHIRAGFNLGADDYIVKPIDWHELNARIRTKLRVKRVEDALRRRNRELALLPEIAQDLSARLDMNELASIVLERTALALDAANSHLAIFHPDGTTFQKLFANGAFVNLSEEAQKRLVSDGLISHVVPSRQGVIIMDTLTDSRWLKTQNNITRSAVAVPLLGRHDVIGVLTLTHTQPHHFTADHQNLLQAIGSQVAIAAENAQLYSAMEQERERLAAILNAVGDAILVTDSQHQLQLLNPAGRRLLGDEGTSSQNAGSPESNEKLNALSQEAQRTGLSQQIELGWANKRTFQTQITPISEGGSVIIMHDITHFKELERLKNEFLAAASHDLKNPIASLMLSTDLVKRTGPLNDKQEKLMGRIEYAATQMHQLVKDLLDLARADLQTGLNQEDVHLAAMVADVHEEFLPQAEAKQQTLEYQSLTNGLPLTIHGDASRLQQVFRNLIGNAVKYTPNNGRITITTNIEDHQARIDIQDTGIGIPAPDLPHIFDSFYRVESDDTRDIEGSGLGLAIVKSIVDQHGGHIEAKSLVGEGTHFMVTFPLTTADSPELLQAVTDY